MKVVAEAIGDLHYETLSELFNQLGLKFSIDSGVDFDAGRQRLADVLLTMASQSHFLMDSAKRAWQISKPFMDKQEGGK